MFAVPDPANAPPYPASGPTHGTFNTSTGRTYYDYDTDRMIEIYDSHCVPIFEGSTSWPCHFLNTNKTAYLITFTASAHRPPCCIFQQPFYPPPPNFLDNVPYNGTSLLAGRTVNWWGFPGPAPGPFSYGFFEDQIPAAFWFLASPGWASQHFSRFEAGPPPQGVFDLPASCSNAPPCPP